MTEPETLKRATSWTGKPASPCLHAHRMEGTGGHFYHSVGLLQCSMCGGWQAIRKEIK